MRRADEISRRETQGKRSLVFSPELSKESPASRIRVYDIARILHDEYDVVVLGVEGNDKNHTRGELQLLKNTARLFPLARGEAPPLSLLVQRGINSILRVALLGIWRKVTGNTLIFDFDDSIFLNLPIRTKAMCRIADAVVVSNENLATYARNHNKHVYIVPSGVDLDLYRAKRQAHQEPPVIGWIGTPSNLSYLRLLDNPLRLLQKSHDFIFRVITDPAHRSRIPLDADLPLDVVGWSYPHFVEKLATVDVGVCPMTDDPWTRGKSGYKILEYMALEIPPVASRVPVAEAIIIDSVNGFLASNTAEWVGRLRMLLDNTDLRSSIGSAGRRTVESQYSLRESAHQLAKIMKL